MSLSIVTGAVLLAPSLLAADQDSDVARESTIRESVVKISANLRYPDIVRPWTKQSPRAGQRHRGRHRRQADPDQRPRGPLRQPALGGEPAVQRQADRHGRGRQPRDGPGGPQARRRVVLREAPPAGPRRRRSPRSRTPSWSTAIPRGARASRSPRGSSRGSSSPATTTALSGLRIQVDAAINPGNSGGPALVDGKMIGLIFSKLTQADNIGYIIPSEEIDLFLKDVADGKYDGKPAMHDSLQTMENPALRGFLRLDKKTQGMIVHAPAEPKADYPLKDWDLITKIGDRPRSTTSAWSRSRTTCACSSST